MEVQQKIVDRKRHWNVLMGCSAVSSFMSQDDSSILVNENGFGLSIRESNALICQKCKLLFYGRSRVSNLNKHVGATHLKKRPHICEECGKAFQYAYKLSRHRDSVHRGLKPYRCPDCDKQFSDRSNMTKHVRNKSCYRKKDSLSQ